MKQFFTFTLCCSLLALGTAFADNDPNKKAKPQHSAAHPATHHAPTKTNTAATHTNTANVHNNASVHQNNSLNVHNNNSMHANNSVHNNNSAHVNNSLHVNNHNNNSVHANVNNSVHNNTVNKTVTKNFQPQHNNFHAQPNTTIKGVQFNQHYTIAGAHNWHGHQYAVFQNYHPAWHDHFWWHNHYHNVVLVGGGWYYWNAGYWYPAWGYDSSAAYYPYDGPIYVGSNPTPPDQMIADVQSTLQQQGYYQGEIDGLLGPQTRAALADYQQAQGLETTAAMDEPTLQSLGMS